MATDQVALRTRIYRIPTGPGRILFDRTEYNKPFCRAVSEVFAEKGLLPADAATAIFGMKWQDGAWEFRAWSHAFPPGLTVEDVSMTDEQAREFIAEAQAELEKSNG